MSALNPMTPGVYTVEKSAFPPSIGEVPTAIPAFVGYTEMAVDNGKSLINTPVLISSLTDYNTYFGGAPDYTFPINQVNESIPGTPPDPSTYDFTDAGKYYKIGPAAEGLFYMYNALRMFYINGGGQAYIVSVGTYIENGAPYKAQKPELMNGLALLETIQFPKPTMILIPDALTLSASQNTAIQQQMIAQAGELGDRVAMLDIYDGYKDLSSTVISDFRNGVGVTFLDKAIAYYPWLQCSVVDPSELNFANIYTPTAQDLAPAAGGPANIGDLLPGYKNTLVKTLSQLAADWVTLDEKLMVPPPLILQGETQPTQFPNWSAAFNGSPATEQTGMITDQGFILAEMYDLLYKLGNSGVGETGQDITLESSKLISALAIFTNTEGSIAAVMETISQYEANWPGGAITSVTSKLQGWGLTPSQGPSPYPTPTTGESTADQAAIAYTVAEPLYSSTYNTLYKALNNVITTANTLLTQNNTALELQSAQYTVIMTAIANQANILPPCAAMAGIYSLVDNTFGVWHAPANINIDSVTAPMVSINDQQQESLNVDVLAGKSINCIRSFYGRGAAIVWGARTLDGNSNDWRYVPVRRTMIMIEQSVANAAFTFVFAPNDSTTWSALGGAISNFLNGLWHQGALQGSAAADAFSVEVGLGKTMSSLDILNGIMRVSVKVALVHPAEFIIITYEQEMAKS